MTNLHIELRLQLALDTAQIGTFIWHIPENRCDPDARTLALLGQPEDSALSIGAAFSAMLHPDDHERYGRGVAAALDPMGDGVLREDVRLLVPDGSLRTLSVTGQVYFEGDPRMPTILVGAACDITERRIIEDKLRASEERNAFLLELSDALRPLGDPIEIQAVASRLLGEHVRAGNVRYYEHHDAAGYGIVHRDYVRGGASSIAGTYRPAEFPALFEACRRGVLLVEADVVNAPSLSAGERTVCDALGVRAVICAPLLKDQELVAVFAVSATSMRTWTSDEVSLVEETAERTWAAVQRARAERATRESEERQAYLLALSDALRPLSDANEIQNEAARILGECLDADWAFYAECDEETTVATVHRMFVGKGAPVLVGRHPLEPFSPLLEVLRKGRAVSFADTQTSPLFTEEGRRVYSDVGLRSGIAAPIVRCGVLIGSLSVLDRSPRVWTPLELALVEGTAERTWAAVQRARAEAALRESDARRGALVENIPQLVWAAESGGDWLWASPQWTSFTGLSNAASRHRGWLEALHPEDRVLARAAFEQADAMGHIELDFRLRSTETDRYRWFQTRATPVRGEDGKIIEWFGTCTDVEDQMHAREVLARGSEELETLVAERTRELQETLWKLHREGAEREQAEQRLLQSEKLKAIGQLTGGIAHDFNNMLQALTNILSLIRALLRRGETERIHGYLERADRTVARASALTHRLLAFGRQQTLASEPMTLEDVARGMEDIVRRSVGPSIQVELELGSAQWRVMCDKNQMESALLNLCVNARDAMPGGGWLTIGTEEVVLTEAELAQYDDAKPGRYIAISVSDTGTGMSPEVVSRAFEPFYTTKPLGEGTGLGLSQIYGLVRQLGGIVQIETAVGKGTTVRLCMPAFDDNPDYEPRAEEIGKTLLLVEDEQEIRELTGEQLRELGYRVLEADSGPAALRVVRSGAHVDLIISDIGLPGGMDGQQLARALRERQPGVPVILMTGYAGGRPMPDADVIFKPFAPDRLAELVKNKLEQEPPG